MCFHVSGHRGVVNSVSWSFQGRSLLTSSEDKTASVWSVGLSDPLMTIQTQNNNFGADKEGGIKPDKVNTMLLFSLTIKSMKYSDGVMLCYVMFMLYIHMETFFFQFLLVLF